MKRIRLSRRFRPFAFTLWLLALTLIFSVGLKAQSVANSTPSSSEESRIQRARALIAAHQLEVASTELENIRANTQDASTRSISSLMLMSIYLEEGTYGRAEALLEENFKARSSGSDSVRSYFALAGQAVNGTRSHLARYRSFGVNTADESLPAEVSSDLTRLRSLVERMIAQAKEISTENKGYASLSLLEDVLGIRLSLAVDSEDQSRWAAEYANARQTLASQRTEIASLTGISALPPKGANKPISSSPYSSPRAGDVPASVNGVGVSEQQHPSKDPIVPKPSGAASTAPALEGGAGEGSVVDLGLLNPRATKRVVPRYPPLAKQSGTVGTVRVYLIINEKGEVVEITRSEGPLLLRRAAEEAARKWIFTPNPTVATPARMSGYLDFDFML